MHMPQINRRARGEMRVFGSASSAWPLLRLHLLEPQLSENFHLYLGTGLKTRSYRPLPSVKVLSFVCPEQTQKKGAGSCSGALQPPADPGLAELAQEAAGELSPVFALMGLLLILCLNVPRV